MRRMWLYILFISTVGFANRDDENLKCAHMLTIYSSTSLEVTKLLPELNIIRQEEIGFGLMKAFSPFDSKPPVRVSMFFKQVGDHRETVAVVFLPNSDFEVFDRLLQ